MRGFFNRHREARDMRINEQDVPESRHSLFFRGLGSECSSEQIRSFFQEEVGPCMIDFFKTTGDKSFVAVRFENREDAQTCMERYKDQKVFTYDVELTWYRDIRRYVSHCTKMGIQPGRRRVERGGGFSGGYGGRRRFSRASRSPRRSHSRSSHSEHSASSHEGSPSPKKRRSESEESHRSEEVRRDRYRDEEVSDKESPRKRRRGRRSRSRNRDRSEERVRHSSDMEESDAAEDGEVTNSSGKSPKPVTLPKKITVNPSMLAAVQEEDKKQSVAIIQLPNENPPASNGYRHPAAPNISYTAPPPPPEPKKEAKFIPFGQSREDDHDSSRSRDKGRSHDSSRHESSRSHDNSRSEEGGLSQIKRSIVQDLKYTPPAEEGAAGSGFRLSSLSLAATSEVTREQKLSRLPQELREKVERKRRLLEVSFRQDCQTFGLVAKKLLSKDQSMEQRLKLALFEAMGDLENDILKKLDDYIEELSFLA